MIHRRTRRESSSGGEMQNVWVVNVFILVFQLFLERDDRRTGAWLQGTTLKSMLEMPHNVKLKCSNLI